MPKGGTANPLENTLGEGKPTDTNAGTEHGRGNPPLTYNNGKPLNGWVVVGGRAVYFVNGQRATASSGPGKGYSVLSLDKYGKLFGGSAPPGTGGNGGLYGGGGGGGGDPKKPYENYYTRILNIKPNQSLVAKAAKGNYTMQEFQLLVQREDTNRFLTTAIGQQTVSNFRTMWARIFPSLGSQPALKALRMYLKQEPTKRDTRGGSRYGGQRFDPHEPVHGAYRNITNPTSMRDMYAFLSKTKLFKKVYANFEHTQFEQTLNFAGYQQYKKDFSKIYAMYNGRAPTKQEMGVFFRSHIAPQEFEKNLQTMTTGGEAYKYATGQAVEADRYKMALYGKPGSAATLAKVAQAYQAKQNFQQKQAGQFGFDRDEQRRLTQTNAY